MLLNMYSQNTHYNFTLAPNERKLAMQYKNIHSNDVGMSLCVVLLSDMM